MFGDDSPRTKVISRSTMQVIIAAVMIFVGSIGTVIQWHHYGKVVENSSTPIGATLEFKKSNATMVVQNIFTDRNKDVLIARFTVDGQSSVRLPFKGSDYQLYFVSPDLTNYNKDMSILFGRLSTDGDFFLIIPKPSQHVYNIAIRNTKNLDTEKLIVENSEASKTAIDDQSIGKALSTYKYDPTNNKDSKLKVSDDTALDIVGFRLTLNPAFDSPKYEPKVIDADLLKNDTFDFEEFFNKVFKEDAVNSLQEKFNEVRVKMEQLDVIIQESQKRIDSNPKDTEAKDKLRGLEDQKRDLDKKSQEMVAKIEEYQNLTFNKKLFSNLQTKGRVLEKFNNS